MTEAAVPSAATDAPLPDFLPPALAALARTQPFARGETLFRRGQRPTRMLFVAAGEVHLLRHGLHGQPVVFQRSGAGSFLAEPSIDSARYHCDALAVRAGRACVFPLADFRGALDADPDFAARWRLFLAREIRRLRARAERLAMRSVRERLVHYIECEGEDGTLAWPGELKPLAAELGVTHEALYRALARLAADGLLERTPGCLRLIARGRL
ncbi:Crp/Fnr family transcriptional regulator [Azospira restricta]|uniref:Crp/Fnr family transcriptional regulator n=1 Tax=Azospira restricta TaxID=404405 RepID=A0A974Y3Y2_9RHOO|nr:Crp/Fnr family transcriptional regulator [Azospira restricta]QRJ64144.1 Crp/Fnr family transcriptional regulator [Azospira restricta]